MTAALLSDLVLITGISGSGKSIALHALEDAGYFCVDNLPPELLRSFLKIEQRHADTPRGRIAVAVDVRSAGSLPYLAQLLEHVTDEPIHVAQPLELRRRSADDHARFPGTTATI